MQINLREEWLGRHSFALQVMLPITVAVIFTTSVSSSVLARPRQRTVNSVTPAVKLAEKRAVPIEPISFVQIRRLPPTTSGLDSDNRKSLRRAHERPKPVAAVPKIGGETETMEMKYKRKRSNPNIKFDSGTYFTLSNGFPPGAVSVSGTRPIFTPEGRSTEQEEILWKWDVPNAFRKADMIFQQDRVKITDERFVPLLLQTASANHLMLFDATKGPVWERDIQSLIPGALDESSDAIFKGVKGDSLRFDVAGIACCLDGSFTLVVISPQKATTEIGTRLLVFDRKGNLISQKELAGLTATTLVRNGSGNSYLLSAFVNFEDGKPLMGNLPLADMLLRRDGTLAILFTKADGSPVGDQVEVTEDDTLAVTRNGLTFTLP